ncbi:hypothetical protein ACLBWT_05795 [Paenibacillus sp. D51F]
MSTSLPLRFVTADGVTQAWLPARKRFAALMGERLQDGVLKSRHVGILQLGVAVDNRLHMETDQLGY